MSYVSIGDMAQTYQHRRQNVQIKTDLQRLSQELASGHRADLSTAVTGDYLPIVRLERSLTAARAYETATAEAALVAETMQNALEMVQRNSTELAPALLAASSSEHPTMIQTTSADAAVRFDAVLSAFNSKIADRYAFSGTATDTRAFADTSTILASLQTAIAGQTTATGIEAAVDAWFDTPGGGFDTVAFTGSTAINAPTKLSDSESVQFALTAADPDVRTVLKSFALAALIGQGALSGNTVEQAALSQTAGERMLGAENNLAIVRAKIGTTEARIDKITAANAAETSALEIARADLTAIDPFKTATEIEAVQTQLETLYTLTARLSRLSLSEFLR